MADIVAVEWLPLKAAVRRLSYQLEKLFLRNVGPRAAQHRGGRKLPRKAAAKRASKKKVEKKLGKRAAKKSRAKHKTKAAKHKTKKRASVRAHKSATRGAKAKPHRHAAHDHVSTAAASKPVAKLVIVPPAKPAAKPVSAAERKTILQRMLGRLGG